MKNCGLLFSLPLFALWSCGNPSATSENGDDSATQETTTCYRHATEKDTVTLTLTTVGNKATGNLEFNWFEKDRNTGNISGELRGDTLLLDYIFRAEGMESVREEVFLKKGTDYLHAYGESVEKDNKWVFADHAGLQFNDGIVLKPVPCK